MNTQAAAAPITPPGPCAMVIFGASGDLTKRLLMPAIYNLAAGGMLPEKFAIVGVAIDQMSTDDFREKLRAGVQEVATATNVDEAVWNQAFSERTFYLQGGFDDPQTFTRVAEQLKEVDEKFGTAGNYLFYLATPPVFFGKIVEMLHGAGLTNQDDPTHNWRRVVIEKPFGHDLDTARALDKQIGGLLEENQIYRMDHYLGKETVQNIMLFRFANGIFEPLWNQRYIDHVQITVAETVGVEHRGNYYDKTGAMRDMIPNHIFQLLCLVAMEPPGSFDADAVRDEKSKLLHAIRKLKEEDVLTSTVRGQYDTGKVLGQPVVGYRQSPDVSKESRTETYAAIKLSIDNWRWADVPFYIRTGKSMAKRSSEIAIQFKRAPISLFRNTSVKELTPNWLVLKIQPDEGISLLFEAKIPGISMRSSAVEMKFRYSDYFGIAGITGYETLLYDCMKGDQTLFKRADFVEEGWKVVTPILDVWATLPPRDFPNYVAGSWGPAAADDLLAKEGRAWRNE